eukprot:5243162-Amphidinium_carterae.1
MEGVFRAAEVLKWFLTFRAGEMLEEGPNATVLMQYSCDCTPSRTRKHFTAKAGGMQTKGSRVVGSELFVQQIFITKAGYGKEREKLLVFQDPAVLEHGKGFQAMLAVTHEFLQGAWAVGST